jgi:hypothetical protein
MALITDITCSIPRPDIASLHDQIAAEISKRMLGGAPVLPMSSEDVLAFVMAGSVNLMHGFVTQALKENDPKTMCCDNLVTYGAIHGINLRSSTRAKGYAAITGTPGAVIPPNIRFSGASSAEYKLDPGVTFNPTQLDTTGAAVLRIVAALPGSQFNLVPGSDLVVSTTTPGIDLEATVIGNGLTGGTDNETCDQLRSRIISSEASGVITTNLAWYVQETSKYPGVTRACADECEGCCDPNRMTIYPFMDGVYGSLTGKATVPPYGIPPCDVLDSMNNWMWGPYPGKGQGLAPVGIIGNYGAALPTYFDIHAYCFSGCSNLALQQIVDAVIQYLNALTCVGSAICLEQLRSVIYMALGQGNCFSRIDFEFDDTIGRVDDAFAHLDCGHFAVLRTVCTHGGDPIVINCIGGAPTS